MQVIAVVADWNGEFSLELLELKKGMVSLEPSITCSQCHASGRASRGPIDPDGRSCFVLYYPYHEEDCKVPFSTLSSYLDSNCDCGMHEEHNHQRGKLYWLKSCKEQKNGSTESLVKYSLEYQKQTCTYVDAVVDDLIRVKKEVQSTLLYNQTARHSHKSRCILL